MHTKRGYILQTWSGGGTPPTPPPAAHGGGYSMRGRSDPRCVAPAKADRCASYFFREHQGIKEREAPEPLFFL